MGGAGTLALTMRPRFLNAVVDRLMAFKVEFPVIKMETPVVPQNHLLEISTFKRKKAKVKKSKLRQRRKKMRRLSDAKREKKNY